MHGSRLFQRLRRVKNQNILTDGEVLFCAEFAPRRLSEIWHGRPGAGGVGGSSGVTTQPVPLPQQLRGTVLQLPANSYTVVVARLA